MTVEVAGSPEAIGSPYPLKALDSAGSVRVYEWAAPVAADALIARLRDEHPAVRDAATWALDELNS